MKIGNTEFDWNNGTSYVMGILNVTPDSFSDGSKFNTLDKAIDHAAEMIADGASIIDVGGESTRPGYTQISDEEEIARVVPVIEALKKRFDIPLSVDTYKSAVADAALSAGADLLNDIWGLKYDDNIAGIVAKHNKPVCLMHNRKEIPLLPGDKPYPLEEYLSLLEMELQESIDIALQAGIKREQLILDPGIGFAKDLDMNINGVAYIERLKKFNLPILLGISRKSIIGKSLSLDMNEREEATIALNVIGRMYGCHIFRVHNVRGNVRALKMTDIILNAKK
ncbi:MAG: dihydropteroate synthase [Lachnospiraceae bacterium]|jgi:dihydropteroate synthase|nr:dihydropteroate synthase [Lachnospiraceae bacterium]